MFQIIKTLQVGSTVKFTLRQPNPFKASYVEGIISTVDAEFKIVELERVTYDSKSLSEPLSTDLSLGFEYIQSFEKLSHE